MRDGLQHSGRSLPTYRKLALHEDHRLDLPARELLMATEFHGNTLQLKSCMGLCSLGDLGKEGEPGH